MRSQPSKPFTRRSMLLALSVVTLSVSACGSVDDDDAHADDVASLRDLTTPDTVPGDETTNDPVTNDTATNDPVTNDTATTDAASSDAGSSESSELEAPEDPEEAFALYDQCLQDHGVDPGEGFVVGNGDAVAVAPAGGVDGADSDGSDDQVFVYAQDANGNDMPPPDDDLIAASEACRGHLANATPDFDLTPEQEAAMEDAQLAFQQCMEDHGIEGGGFSISVGGGGAGLEVDEQQVDDQAAPPSPSDIDPEEFQAAAEACQSVYDDYPELDDVFPDGGPMGGVSVAHTESTGGS